MNDDLHAASRKNNQNDIKWHEEQYQRYQNTVKATILSCIRAITPVKNDDIFDTEIGVG
jgi:hypothetical protein